MNPTFPIISNKPTYSLKIHVQTNCQTGKEIKMQEALPYTAWSQIFSKPKRAKNDFNLNTSPPLEEDKITKMASENAVIVFGRSGCCLCYVVKRLFEGLGVNPVVHEIQDADLKYFDGKFKKIVGKLSGGCQFPTVFIGGELYGGLDNVIAMHISGELVPLLKQAGALWL